MSEHMKKKKNYLVYMTGGWRWRLCGRINIAPPAPFGKEVATEDDYPQKYDDFHAFLKLKMFESNVFKVKAYKDMQMTCTYQTPNPTKNVFLGTSVVK